MRPLLLLLFCLVSSVAFAIPKTLASGPLLHNGTTYQNAVITYDSEIDESGTGNNPGLKIWSNSTRSTLLIVSVDSNASWDYNPAGAFFENGQAVVIGLKEATDFSRSLGRVWRSDGTTVLEQTEAQFGYINEVQNSDVFRASPFSVIVDDKSVQVYVQHNRAADYSQSGNFPSLTVRSQTTGAVLWESRDANVVWDYSMYIAFAFEGKLYITGARRDNASGQFFPRIWTTDGTGNAELRQINNSG
jgi:hypothetical protein